MDGEREKGEREGGREGGKGRTVMSDLAMLTLRRTKASGSSKLVREGKREERDGVRMNIKSEKAITHRNASFPPLYFTTLAFPA